jgi:uncharacterized membrane protein YoaK (UPF0700 family)
MSSFPGAQAFGQTVAAPGWRAHRIRDILLAVLAFAAGSIDVLSWLAVGKVFSAFMTGNVVFLAAGLFTHHSELSVHAALAGLAVLIAVIIVFMIELARGHSGSPYAWLGAIGGLTYLVAIVVVRIRG